MTNRKELPIITLTSLGQSLWYDNIQRRLRGRVGKFAGYKVSAKGR